MDSRRNLRAVLRTRVNVQGTDRWGKPFHLEGESVDFSRRGIGLCVKEDLVSPGAVVSVSIPDRFQGRAEVRWSRPADDGKVRIGLNLLHCKSSVGLRIAACFLLCLAFFGQIGFGRNRSPRHYKPAYSCTMSLARMKAVLESVLGGYAAATESDKTFLHVQHERLGCDEYTRLYEQSDFTRNEKTRAAIARWHWEVYHSNQEKVRAAAVHEAEGLLHADN
jgi:hypothetical protein